jgi:hypothetical protein
LHVCLSITLCTWPLVSLAQQAKRQNPAPDDPSPAIITVRPSGTDSRTPEALTAEERIERRLKRSDQMLRSICIGCGTRDAASVSAPFNPGETLHPPREGAPSQMLLPRQLPDEVSVEIKQVPVAGPMQPTAEPPAVPPQDSAPAPDAR